MDRREALEKALAAERELRVKQFESAGPLTESDLDLIQDAAERDYPCGESYAWRLAVEVKRLRGLLEKG